MAAPNAIPRLRMRPMTAAARPGNSSVGPSANPNDRPVVGMTSVAVSADSAPAIAHDIVAIAVGDMPARAAASGFAAAARIAMPKRDRRKKVTRPISTMGVKITMP